MSLLRGLVTSVCLKCCPLLFFILVITLVALNRRERKLDRHVKIELCWKFMHRSFGNSCAFLYILFEVLMHWDGKESKRKLDCHARIELCRDSCVVLSEIPMRFFIFCSRSWGMMMVRKVTVRVTDLSWFNVESEQVSGECIRHWRTSDDKADEACYIISLSFIRTVLSAHLHHPLPFFIHLSPIAFSTGSLRRVTFTQNRNSWDQILLRRL